MSKLKKFIKKYVFLFNALMFILGAIAGIVLSPQIFFIYHTGLFGLSDFNYLDDEFFQDIYKVDNFYTYYIANENVSKSSIDKALTVSIQNKWVHPIKAKTILELPEFMNYECETDKPSEDNCDNYIISGDGGIRELRYNITVGDTSKANHKICFITDTVSKRSKAFSLKEKECLEIFISQ